MWSLMDCCCNMVTAKTFFFPSKITWWTQEFLFPIPVLQCYCDKAMCDVWCCDKHVTRDSWHRGGPLSPGQCVTLLSRGRVTQTASKYVIMWHRGQCLPISGILTWHEAPGCHTLSVPVTRCHWSHPDTDQEIMTAAQAACPAIARKYLTFSGQAKIRMLICAEKILISVSC